MLAKILGINLVALTLFVFDRVFKIWFYNNPTETFGGNFILSLRYATNSGIAFGFSVSEVVLPIVIAAVIVFLINELLKAYRSQDLVIAFCLSLIVVGALSNFIDRMRYGFVIDYIDLKYFSVFNLGDAMITIGVAILIFYIWLAKKY